MKKDGKPLIIFLIGSAISGIVALIVKLVKVVGGKS